MVSYNVQVRKKEAKMQIITTLEASKLLKLDVRTLQKQAKGGKFPAEVCGRVGRKYLFNADALLAYIFSPTVERG